jgi:hypothetical protein
MPECRNNFKLLSRTKGLHTGVYMNNKFETILQEKTLLHV